jgi:hypothetical protein
MNFDDFISPARKEGAPRQRKTTSSSSNRASDGEPKDFGISEPYRPRPTIPITLKDSEIDGDDISPAEKKLIAAEKKKLKKKKHVREARPRAEKQLYQCSTCPAQIELYPSQAGQPDSLKCRVCAKKSPKAH